MTAKSKKARRAGKRSGGGRPRKEGARYPSGELRPPAPNTKVLEARRYLLGVSSGEKVDLSKAESPFDLALARGWLSEEDHRAGRAYAALYRRGGVDLPRIKTANMQEGEGEYSRSRGRGTELLESGSAAAVSRGEGDPEAQNTLRDIWANLKPAERTELLNICVLGSWPQWIIWRSAGREVPQTWEQRRTDLLQGLTVVRTILDPRRKRGQHSGNDKLADVRAQDGSEAA